MKKLLLSLLALAGLSASAQTFELITDAKDLTVGAEYILVGKKASDNTYAAMGAANATTASFRKAVTVTVKDGVCDITKVEGVTPFTIENGSDADTYAFKLTDGKYINVSNPAKNNQLTEVDAVSVSTSFTIAFAKDGSGALTIIGIAKTDAGALKTNQLIGYNSSSPRFSNYKNTNTGDYLPFLYKKSAGEVTVARPAFSVAAGDVEKGTKVAITCSTEGAEIYYTLDGTEPTSASTKYTEAITINATTTVKAVAVKGTDSSSVATATYTVVDMMTLAEANELENGESFIMGSELVVVYANEADTRYNYVYDATDGTYALLYSTQKLGLKTGDVIAKGWAGKMSYYGGLPELVPSAGVTVSGTTETLPAPKEVAAAEIKNTMVGQYIIVKGVEFAAATPATNTDFTGKVGDASIAFRNPYKLASVAAGKYDVKAFVSVYTKDATTLSENVQLFPVEFATPTSGIADIEAEGAVAPVYYNLQGVRVANPENGLFIEVRGNKAVKVVK